MRFSRELWESFPLADIVFKAGKLVNAMLGRNSLISGYFMFSDTYNTFTTCPSYLGRFDYNSSINPSVSATHMNIFVESCIWNMKYSTPKSILFFLISSKKSGIPSMSSLYKLKCAHTILLFFNWTFSWPCMSFSTSYEKLLKFISNFQTISFFCWLCWKQGISIALYFYDPY